MFILNFNKLSYEQNRLLNDIAIKSRYSFNRIIEEISKDKLKSINWIVSAVSSRNKYISDLFLRCCYLDLIDYYINENIKIDRIISNDRQICFLLNKHFKKINYYIDIECTETILPRLWRIMRPFRQYILAIMLLLLRYLGRKKVRLKDINDITILDTFVLNSTPGDGGTIHNNKYNDRYYTNIFNYVSSEEKEYFFYYPTIVGFKNPIRIFKKIRSCNDNFIIPDDFLKLSDYLKILTHPFRIMNVKVKDILYSGFEISSLIKEEKFRTCSDHISIFGLLNYYFSYRLRKKGVKVRLLIDWYENQVLDRGMIAGFKKFHKETPIIGYQGYIISPVLHSYIYPNNTELESNCVPDEIAVIGDELVSNMFTFCKNLKVVTAPAFRNQNVWEKRKYYPSKDNFQILLALPITLDESKKIIEKILLIKKEIEISLKRLKFTIKPHPTNSEKDIKKLFNDNQLDEFQFEFGNFNNVLEFSNLLITNASTVAMEALTKGIPVIVIGDNNGITQNPIPKTIKNLIWKIVYSKKQLSKAISSFFFNEEVNKEEYFKIADEVKKSFFRPVNTINTRRMLKLDNITPD